MDVSERMLERARQVTAAERLGNVRYVLGDAQVHRFDPAGLDVAIRRFGTMFFSDPAAAFANIAAALRPEARLVLLVWQRLEDNEWARAIDAALGDAAQPPPPGADPFSLGDHEATARVLERLRETLAAHYSDERGVVLGSRSWLITARRRRYES